MPRLFVLALASLAAPLGIAAAAGCSSSSTSSPTPPSNADGSVADAASVTDSGASPDGASADSGGNADTAGSLLPVTFVYAPQWEGVTKVEVVGGFGQSTDWSRTASLLSLTQGASGWSGTAMLPPGTYLYVYRVTGDSLAANPATYVRYAVDPLDTAFDACPAASPTYSKIDVNPCSSLTVAVTGAPPPAAPVHVRGVVQKDGAPASGWMVWLERDEPMSHHFFANRVTLDSTGSFDLVASSGAYRLQIQHPTLLSETDLQRAPASLAALRRAISASFPLTTGDLTVPTPDVAFHDYPAFAPSGDAGSLPTTFAFEPGAAHLDVYGGGGDAGVVNIGDPWFSSPLTTDGGAVFSGSFDTKQALADAAAPGVRYMWGTEQPFGADAGLAWTNQSMVLPVVWR